jgi:hypothetical protein
VKTLVSILINLGFFVCCAAYAGAPADAPAGTTGQCKDGSWSSAASKKGACRGHQGVKAWYAADEAPTPAKSAPADTTQTSASASSKNKHADSSPASTSAASAPASAPSNATGLCNDGTYYTGENKKGACRGHKGIKAWYGATASTATTTAAKTTTPSATPAPATMPPQTFPKSTPTTMPNAQTPTTGTQTATRPTLPGGTSATPVAGGGAGTVWVNSSSKVYHCPGDRYYGTTKSGEYMTEGEATAKGNRPAHGKSCSS